MKKRWWLIPIVIVLGILVIPGPRRYAVCIYCKIAGTLKHEGSTEFFPQQKYFHAFPQPCTQDTFQDLEFQIRHECGINLSDYQLRITMGHVIYEGPFKETLHLKQVHRCISVNERDLWFELIDPEKKQAWQWDNHLNPILTHTSRFDVSLLLGKETLAGDEKAYNEFLLQNTKETILH